MKTINDKKNDKKSFLSRLHSWIDSMKKVDDDDYENLDFLPNPKYKEYADENGEIPIFVMEKKHLITDWASKIPVPLLGLFFSLFFFGKLGESPSNNNTLELILGYFFAIGCSLLFIESTLHDILIRKIICYDKYLKIINRFRDYKKAYSQIKYFYYMKTSILSGKILYFCTNRQFTYILKRLYNSQFKRKDLEYLVRLLLQKGVKERGLLGYKN